MDTAIGWCPANRPLESDNEQVHDLVEQSSLLTPAATPTKTLVFDPRPLSTAESAFDDDMHDTDLETSTSPSGQSGLPPWIRSLFIDCGTHLTDEISKTNKLREEAIKKERKRMRGPNVENKNKVQQEKRHHQEKTHTQEAKQTLQEVGMRRRLSEMPAINSEREQSRENITTSRAEYMQRERLSEDQRTQVRQRYQQKYNIHRFGLSSGGKGSREDGDRHVNF